MEFEMIKTSNIFIIIMALAPSMPSLGMEPHPRRADIDAYLATHPNEPPLIRAAIAGNTTQVAQLLDGGANVDEKGTSKFTPLILAASFGHREICRILIARGAPINYLIGDSIYMGGLSPLIIAAEMEQNDICRLLIQSKADVFIKNRIGWSALHHAQNQGASDTCKLLINAMLKPNREQKKRAYFILYHLNKKYPMAKDTNRLIVKHMLFEYMQLNKPMVITEIKKVNRPDGLINYVNTK
jgi:ankyrin repeat protein